MPPRAPQTTPADLSEALGKLKVSNSGDIPAAQLQPISQNSTILRTGQESISNQEPTAGQTTATGEPSTGRKPRNRRRKHSRNREGGQAPTGSDNPTESRKPSFSNLSGQVTTGSKVQAIPIRTITQQPKGPKVQAGPSKKPPAQGDGQPLTSHKVLAKASKQPSNKDRIQSTTIPAATNKSSKQPSSQTYNSPRQSRHYIPPRQSKRLQGVNPRLYLLPQPAPNSTYLQLATARSFLIPIPRKLLIVLDLNGTLLVRKNKSSSFLGRPHVQEFLRYVLNFHKIVIWSSARPHNVAAMVDQLLTPGERAQLLAVWSRDHLRLGAHYDAKVQVYKQLSWLWADSSVQQFFDPAEAGYGTQWDQTNTVLIDDTVDKAASEPFNLLKIEEFTHADQDLGVEVLAQIVEYLEKLKWQSNASSFIKGNPFQAQSDSPGLDWNKFERECAVG